MPLADQIKTYIRQAATARGIDPDQAVRVAKSEGLGSYVGDNGSSFGPFQLHYGGVAPGGNAVGGLGDAFTAKTGLDARDPRTVPAQIDFALDHAKQNGWGAWHGWKGDVWAGIGPKPPAAQGVVPQAAGAPAPSSVAPQGLLGGLASQPQPQVPAQGAQGLLDQAVDSELTKRLAAIPGLLAQQQQQPAPQPLQPLPQSPARQMAALTTPQMQMAMNSPAAMLRRQILAMMMQPGQQQNQVG